MPWFSCPHCGEEDAIKMEIVTAYEPDTNAGGAPEVVEQECDCQWTAKEGEALYLQAAIISAHDWWRDDD